MENSKQTAELSSQRVITKDEWVDLSRKLVEKARSGFSDLELASIAGFINYVAPDVEAIQQEEAV